MNFLHGTLLSRYIFALGLNFFGIGLQGVVIPWLLLEQTHAPAAVGVLLILRGLVAIFLSPHAGSLSDRMQRRALAVRVNLSLAALVLLFSLYLQWQTPAPWTLYLLTLVMSLANTYFLPAVVAHIQSLVQPESYPRIAASREIAMQIGVIGGTFAAGLILHTCNMIQVFVLIGIAFGASGLAYLSLPPGAMSDAPRVQRGFIGNFQNMREIFAVPQLAWVIGLLMAPTLAVQVDNVLISGYVQQVLKESAMSFSVVNAAYSSGALVASLLMAQFAARLPLQSTVLLLFCGMGGAHLFFGLSNNLALAICAAVLIGLTLVPLRIMLNTVLMRATSAESVGRTQAALQMASSLAVVLVGISAGAGAQIFGFFAGFAFVFLICILAAAVGCIAIAAISRREAH